MPKKKMTERPPFIEQLKARWNEGKIVCVGLDPDIENPKFPHVLKDLYHFNPQTKSGEDNAIGDFVESVIKATGDLVCAFKPNIAFYESFSGGEQILVELVNQVHQEFPDVPVIGDIKRADIGATNKWYAKTAFEKYNFDAVTTNPFFGKDTFTPFLKYDGRGLIILCRTTNPGSRELQDMPIDLDVARTKGLITEEEYTKLDTDILSVYEMTAFLASSRWNGSGNLGLVVGATHPEAFQPIRRLAPDLPFLIPGIGTQGGDLAATLKYAPDSEGQGMIINSGSAIIYASSGENFTEAAREATLKLHNQIVEIRSQNG